MSKHSGDTISLYRHPGLALVANTSKGRAVFANEPIPRRTVLETCPVLILGPKENAEHIQATCLYNYTYNWPVLSLGKQTQALPLGLGGLFNHSNHPYRCNVGWTKNPDPKTEVYDSGSVVQGNDSITYITLRAVSPGEELCISYGPKERLTFVDVEEKSMCGGDREQHDDHDLLQSLSIDLDKED